MSMVCPERNGNDAASLQAMEYARRATGGWRHLEVASLDASPDGRQPTTAG
eukprot:CAMPEP_0203013342 /NCGR_PEP_ID=MMETSP1401-20130829/15054_1 /ASSEMBLY_ACC=CAM_ASM_000894 /TAXON_ID=38833 /ORGANISM="Micromonas pusilla, Strain CCAC1681" /LENGTH=50 /DNA_ID=CAMNT_0049755047 /DNA_START=104 /DNA_END=254 /DNA_ORIENTATION=-